MNSTKTITKKIVITALFASLTLVATFIRLPLPMGYVHLGDGFVLLSAFLLGPLWGTIAAGLGSCLADVFGYIQYAPATLLIKAIMALLAWFTYHGLAKLLKKPIFSEIIAGIVGTIISVLIMRVSIIKKTAERWI